MISEIRTQDLRFTAEETAAYLSQAQFAPVSQNALHLLEERFEGWPAGLHLAALSLRSAGSQESVLSALSSENADITGYLVDEVLTHQFPAIHDIFIEDFHPGSLLRFAVRSRHWRDRPSLECARLPGLD